MIAWTMTKDARMLRCELRAHPLGREQVLHERDELRRSDVVKNTPDLLKRQGGVAARNGGKGLAAGVADLLLTHKWRTACDGPIPVSPWKANHYLRPIGSRQGPLGSGCAPR